MQNPRFLVLAGLILAAAGSRLVPHPPNFTPLAAMALFGGAQFSEKRLALGVPLAALLLSDLVLGFYPGWPAVYVSFAAIVGIGMGLHTRRAVLPVAGAALAASVLFFVVSNFGTWAAGVLYPRTWDGLTTCFVAAVPFFRNTLLGDLFYTAVLFGGFALAEKRFPQLREAVVRT